MADSKISMYQEENNNIQQEISTIVSNYMQYEKDTNKIASEIIPNTMQGGILVLTELYPELKSNDLVNKQIDIYVENNKKIKDLKEQKLNNMVSKWWLYFGKVMEE